MEVQVHDFNGIQIRQRFQDGFVDLTDMAKATNKRLDNWMVLKSTKAYIAVLENSLGSQGVKSEQGVQGGTWAHIDLAIEFAGWVSVDFKFWANRTLRQVMAGEFLALTPGAQESQAQLTSQFQDVCGQLSAAHYELEGFKAVNSQLGAMLGAERATRLEWMANTLNALHSSVTDETIELTIAAIRREMAFLRNQPAIESAN